MSEKGRQFPGLTGCVIAKKTIREILSAMMKEIHFRRMKRSFCSKPNIFKFCK
jgi:hypothetical protein